MKNGKVTQSEGFETLLYQLLETEIGGQKIYTRAIECAVNPSLKEEWQKYLSETKRHNEIARELLTELGFDPDQEVPARKPVRIIGEALLAAMEAASAEGSAEQAEIVAAECVVEAETKDHLNWTLLSLLAEKSTGSLKQTLEKAVDEVEHQEDHHLYHTQGWTRELWLQSLGVPAVLPPPEEVKKVETAIGASRAEQQRDKMAEA